MKSTNGAAWIVNEYQTRMTLAKLGYQFDGDSLDTFLADSFVIIDSEIQKVKEQESKRASRRG